MIAPTKEQALERQLADLQSKFDGLHAYVVRIASALVDAIDELEKLHHRLERLEAANRKVDT